MIAALEKGRIRPEEVFGKLPGTVKEQRSRGERLYRKLAMEVHPDRLGESERKQGEEQFKRLASLWAEAQRLIERGEYGKAIEVVISSRWREYRVGEVVAEGEAGTLYRCGFLVGGKEQLGVLKVAREVGDNELLIKEARAIQELRREAKDERCLPYFPELVDNFKLRWEGVERRAEVFIRLEGFINLEELIKGFPGGLDGGHMAWIWRRLLVALGFSHRAGWMHGAVMPEHIMVDPITHGLVLIGWGYAYKMGEPMEYISGKRKTWYPPDIYTKRPIGTSLDISMGAQTMIELLGGAANLKNVPQALTRYLAGCKYAILSGRVEAWGLLKEFDELIERLYGPRQYKPLIMPTKR